MTDPDDGADGGTNEGSSPGGDANPDEEVSPGGEPLGPASDEGDGVGADGGHGPGGTGDGPAGSEGDADTAAPGPNTGERVDDPDPESGDSGTPASATEEDGNRPRRALLLSLLLLLVLIGGGIGTFVLDDDPDTSPGVQTPTPAPSATPSPTATATVSLAFPEGATLLRADNVVPGDEGTSRLAVRNSGNARGELAIADFTVRDRENRAGRSESSTADPGAAGELSDHLLVRLSVRSPDGESIHVFGGDEFVPLSSVEPDNATVDALGPGETAVVQLDWRVPGETGNEIQGDTTRFDVVFGLRQTNGTASE